jgi:hypothetical protein
LPSRFGVDIRAIRVGLLLRWRAVGPTVVAVDKVVELDRLQVCVVRSVAVRDFVALVISFKSMIERRRIEGVVGGVRMRVIIIVIVVFVVVIRVVVSVIIRIIVTGVSESKIEIVICQLAVVEM